MQPIPLFYNANSNLTGTLSENNPFSFAGLSQIIHSVNEDFFILLTKPCLLNPGKHALERMVQVATDTGAGLLYADYVEIIGKTRTSHFLNDYQSGSIRDDFDFGPLLLVRTLAAKDALNSLNLDLQYAALYDLRLTLSRSWPIFHLNESLYTITESDQQNMDAHQFAYVDPKNRAVQIEMEKVCTKHLKAIGGWLPNDVEPIDLTQGVFPVEASVIIPVRNRYKTISDAIDSVLDQETDFPFNLIVIDNHSTDGTTEIIADKASKNNRIIHLTPDRDDLGIGGCWNEGVQHVSCGRFAVQLDSDDVYSSHHTLAHIVREFYAQQCAMLVGSYRMCNFNLETIPPGIIDHKEWTPENGKNNALRINGLGAPRAFFTPILRTIKVPNTSYGEDYALGLRISRSWKIGRIYEVLYLCRRWEENSDASIDLIKANTFNHYKDKLRSIELTARQQMNGNRRKE